MLITPALIAATGAVFATCQLPSGDIKAPETWGQYFLDKFEAERAEAMNIEPATVPPLAHPRTVLLITGVTIPAVWFDPIKARLERDGYNTVVYEPPDLLSGDLFWNTEQLMHVIDGIRAQTGEERIDVLAECTGGLITRHYIQALGGDAHIRRLVTFISPQHGLPKAGEASLIVNWDAVKDLTPGSEFLETVNNAPMKDVPIVSIYTCTDEYIQPYQTAIIPGAKNIGIGCDGTFVGHYQFFYDREIYKLMHAELTAPAPTDVDPPTPTDPTTDPTDPTDPTDEVADGGGCSSTNGSSAAGMLLLGLLALGRRRRTR